VYGTGIDNPVSMTVYGGTTNRYYYLTDHLGSVLALTDGNGAIVESYRYDAWGRVLGVYDASGSQIDESAVGNRILWQGREYSWKTGLYYFRSRWYDPVTGRWLSNDPIGISGGLNQYVFCADNPVNFTDPYGWCKGAGGGTTSPFLPEAGKVPKGWDPGWPTGVDSRGPFVKDPAGDKWYPHPEDDGHWPHYDSDKGKTFPEKSVKPWPGQNRPPYGRQSSNDPWQKTSLPSPLWNFPILPPILRYPWILPLAPFTPYLPHGDAPGGA